MGCHGAEGAFSFLSSASYKRSLEALSESSLGNRINALGGRN